MLKSILSGHRAVRLALGLALTLWLGSFSPAEAGPAAGAKPGAVYYGVVPPLFGHEPLKSVTAKLEHLASLGVDVVWLSTIFETNDDSLISYAITDYKKLRPDYGTEEDLRALVKAAHSRGMKVILDIVPNHTSSEHPFFDDAITNKEASPYHGFYEWKENGDYSFYYDWENLPNLNLNHPGAREMMLDAFRYWVREFGIDGYRMDVAWGVKERAPTFWRAARRALDEIRPGLILIAEASARDSYYFENGFDLAYDWAEGNGTWAWKGVFAKKPGLAARLHRALLASRRHEDGIVRFLNNNDTGRRFLSRYGAGRARVAAVLQYTLPGAPLLYTGDEVGAAYDPYQDPPPISFEDPHGLIPLYQKLGALRESLAPLREGDWEPAEVSLKGEAYAYARKAGGETALVVLNFGAATELRLELPMGHELKGSTFRDELSGKTWPVRAEENGRKLRIRVPRATSLVLTTENPTLTPGEK